jgi:hypothetical protein
MVWTLMDAAVISAAAAAALLGTTRDRRALERGESLSRWNSQRLRESLPSRYFVATVCILSAAVCIYYGSSPDQLDHALAVPLPAGGWLSSILPAALLAASIGAVVFGAARTPPLPGLPGWLRALLRACSLIGGLGMLVAFGAAALGYRVDPLLGGFLMSAVLLAAGVLAALQLWSRCMPSRASGSGGR